MRIEVPHDLPRENQCDQTNQSTSQATRHQPAPLKCSNPPPERCGDHNLARHFFPVARVPAARRPETSGCLLALSAGEGAQSMSVSWRGVRTVSAQTSRQIKHHGSTFRGQAGVASQRATWETRAEHRTLFHARYCDRCLTRLSFRCARVPTARRPEASDCVLALSTGQASQSAPSPPSPRVPTERRLETSDSMLPLSTGKTRHLTKC